MSRLASLSAVACLAAFSAGIYAEPVSGDFGLQLGATVERQSIIGPVTEPHGASLYAIRPPAPQPHYVEYFVGLSSQQRIGLIRARSAPMATTACYRTYRATSKQLQERHPHSGYYALDDGDMYYDGTRQVVVACEVDGNSGRVVVEYVDETIDQTEAGAVPP